MNTINDIVKDILLDLGFENLYYTGILQKNWEKIVGELIASVSTPERIQNKILYVKCSNPAWKQELYFFREKMLSCINSYLKNYEIRDIKIFFSR